MNTEDNKFFEELLVRRKNNTFQFTPLARPCVMGGRRSTMTPRRLFHTEGSARSENTAAATPVDSSPIRWAPSASVPYLVFPQDVEVRQDNSCFVPWRPWEDDRCHLPICGSSQRVGELTF
jgi:hypothetical protein